MTLMQKYFSLAAFALFSGGILLATMYYAPRWGLMDDLQSLGIARGILHSPNPLQTYWDTVWAGATGIGIFRPVYFLWVVTVYNIFPANPTAIYVLIALINMIALVVWGKVIYKYYHLGPKDFYWASIFFPLTFFLFTPFWNIFMYISLQEKFVVFFGALSFFFFKRSYETSSLTHLSASLLFFTLGLFIKPTMFSFILAYTVFAAADYFLFKVNPAVSLKYLGVNACLIAAYAFFSFTVQLKGAYTANYGQHLAPAVLIHKILTSGLIVKFLFLSGIAAVAWNTVYFILTKNNSRVFSMLFPLAMTGYLLLLTPWGYQSYLLCSLAPLVLGTLFPVFDWLVHRGRMLRVLTFSVLAMMMAAVFTGIILPRISKMGEIAKAEDFIKTEAIENKGGRFFFPPPYMESAYALHGFTQQDIMFLQDGNLAASSLAPGNNYLLVNDQCSSIRLQGVRLGEKVYSNHTWQIYRLAAQRDYSGQFNPEFNNHLIKAVKALRNL